jgi:undecaprenyl-diphosphatase
LSILQAVVLGCVQGLTEFVPISSSGHLVIVPEVLGWAPPGLAFDVLLHIGSLIALVVYFFRDLMELLTGVIKGDKKQRRLLRLLIVGTVPAVIAALALSDYFDKAYEDARASAIQLLITAAILVGAELALRFHQRRTAARGSELRRMENLREGDAAVIGIGQAVAILPGISRSGTTIAAGLALSMERNEAARFSFILALPALFGAALIEVPELAQTTLGAGSAAAGLLASLVTSYVAIAALLRYLRSNTLYVFAAYCVLAGIIFLSIL